MINEIKNKTLSAEEVERLASKLYNEARSMYATTWLDTRLSSNNICRTVLSYHVELRQADKYGDVLIRFYELVEQGRQPQSSMDQSTVNYFSVK